MTKSRLSAVLNRWLVALIRLYQYAIAPCLGCRCRFTPSCSHYAVEALALHGLRRGGWLACKRLVRCHPFGRAGFDPVPDSTGESTA